MAQISLCLYTVSFIHVEKRANSIWLSAKNCEKNCATFHPPRVLTLWSAVRYTGDSAPETEQTTENEDGTHEKTQHHLPAAGSPDAAGLHGLRRENSNLRHCRNTHKRVIFKAFAFVINNGFVFYAMTGIVFINRI